ncbi:hypothetical protein CDL15_Pgr009857 [Punica granatum]|uniref:Uncharacterized protein n=1 Tax=Punica granatum TaxID=22663 RepID=A0A218WVD8_PUNGR|nr:hypothetical protein CDL15_Pgr009857 [Punica granatum]PKI76996.1 hypothetical protein CRG98_002499 [Punica granatum]
MESFITSWSLDRETMSFEIFRNKLLNQESPLRQPFPETSAPPATALLLQTQPNKSGRGNQNGGSRGGSSNKGGGRGSGRFNDYGNGPGQQHWNTNSGSKFGRGSGGRGQQGQRGGYSLVVYCRGQSTYTPFSVRTAGNSPSPYEGILGHGPTAFICQISNSADHTTLHCLEYYNHNQSQPVPKSLAALTLNDHPTC